MGRASGAARSLEHLPLPTGCTRTRTWRSYGHACTTHSKISVAFWMYPRPNKQSRRGMGRLPSVVAGAWRKQSSKAKSRQSRGIASVMLWLRRIAFNSCRVRSGNASDGKARIADAERYASDRVVLSRSQIENEASESVFRSHKQQIAQEVGHGSSALPVAGLIMQLAKAVSTPCVPGTTLSRRGFG